MKSQPFKATLHGLSSSKFRALPSSEKSLQPQHRTLFKAGGAICLPAFAVASNRRHILQGPRNVTFELKKKSLNILTKSQL